MDDFNYSPPYSFTHTETGDFLTDPADNLSLDRLLSMTPIVEERDLVALACRHLLLSKLKSQPDVKDVFFQSHVRDVAEDLMDDDWFDFELYSTLYVCQAISHADDPFRLGDMINREKLESYVQHIVQSPDWKKLGFAMYTTLFPSLVKDPETFTPFGYYLQNRCYWAQTLYEGIHNSVWLYNNVIGPVSTHSYSSFEYNRDLNILLIKLHLLDPTLVMPAYRHLQKALPDLQLQLATTNYLGTPLDWKLIAQEVSAVINKANYPNPTRRDTLSEFEVFYGVEVLEFLMKEPRELELLTDKLPHNKRKSTLRDRCVLL